MKILIVSATLPEIMPSIKVLAAVRNDDVHFYHSVYKSHQVDFLITGVGMVSTAFYCAKALAQKYDFALNAGIAGSFNRNLALGDVVNVVQDRFSEMGAENDEQFLSIEQLGLLNELSVPLSAAAEITNTCAGNNPVLEDLPKVNGITVNKVHGNPKSIEDVWQGFHPMVESMEGAAFLFSCVTEKVNCAQVRAISNYVEKRNREAWDIPSAIKNLNGKIVEIINAF
jgi:futalosine hydrolase